MGRKSLPDPHARTRPYWGFVELVTHTAEDVRAALQGGEYETKTRGTRHQPAARAAAEGVYRLVKHVTGAGRSKVHTYLAHRLELPASEGEDAPQHELHIEPEAVYVIQVKNPEAPAPPNAGLQSREKAAYPSELQDHFQGRRFIPLEKPELLNYVGAEFILISASDDVEEELGLDLHPHKEHMRHPEMLSLLGDSWPKELLRPLFEGKWA
eukprot:SM000021S06471  [mRNA]  locus=s21:504128:504990:- [translate_table: standard]